jgi:hypothetical protein
MFIHLQNETPTQSYVPAEVPVFVTAHSVTCCGGGTGHPNPIPQSIS